MYACVKEVFARLYFLPNYVFTANKRRYIGYKAINELIKPFLN